MLQLSRLLQRPAMGTPRLCNIVDVGGWAVRYTQHRASLVLLAPALCHVARDSQIDNGEIFNAVLVWIEATDDDESPALIYVCCHLVQPRR